MYDLERASADLERLKKSATRLEGVRIQYRKQHADLKSEVERLDRNVLLRSKVSELLKKLLDDEVADKVKSIDDLVTKGLQQVYHDQDISFLSRIEDKNNRLSIEFVTKHGQVEGDTLESFGGGIVNIESFLLRVITIMKMGLAPYIQLDESFANVAKVYVGHTARMVQILCEQLGLDVLLVTHQPEFLDHVDIGYEAFHGHEVDGSPYMKLRRLNKEA